MVIKLWKQKFAQNVELKNLLQNFIKMVLIDRVIRNIEDIVKLAQMQENLLVIKRKKHLLILNGLHVLNVVMIEFMF